MRTIKLFLGIAVLAFLLSACKKEEESSTTESGPRLIFKLKFDPNQERQDAFGQPSTLPAGHAAQSPKFNAMSAHYIELTENEWVMPGAGENIFKGPETTAGGDKAIDFEQAVIKGEDEEFYSVPLSAVKAGTYKYVRVSVTYQNYEIDYRASGLDLKGTIASFVGFNTYLKDHKIKNKSLTVNANKLQGYWAFEDHSFGVTASGQAPAGATTVPNPIASTSPISQGSCLVTGVFGTPFQITGNETKDVVVELSFSVNNSFEWTDNGDGIYEPEKGDAVVDMGLRGLVPIVK